MEALSSQGTTCCGGWAMDTSCTGRDFILVEELIFYSEENHWNNLSRHMVESPSL